MSRPGSGSGYIALHALLERGRSAEHPVCHDGQRYVLWSEFAGRIANLAQQLKARGEQRWLLTGAAPLDFVVKLLAALYAGKQVVVPPNDLPGTLAALAGAYDARLADETLESASSCVALPAIDPQSALIDLYTSGSTGEPKRVGKTLAQFEAEAQVLETLWGETLGSAAMVATAPHQHIYGLLFRLLWPLSAGRLFDAVTCAHPDTLVERLALLGDAALVSSPAQLTRLPELLALSRLAAHSKVVFSSGGPLPASAAIEFFRQLGQAPIEVFGSTETGGIAWRRQDGRVGAERWTPFPGMGIRRSASGALALRSPYLGNSDYQERDDGIELCEDGRFRLLGRIDRIVKIEEKRVSLPDMESRINEQPWVADCALLPLAGRRQRIGALVVLTAEGWQRLEVDGRRALVGALREHLAAHFEAILLPRHWRFPRRLPVNALGKVAHAALAELFAKADDGLLLPHRVGVSRPLGDPHRVVLDLHVAAQIEHFAGHFPGQAILPGVVQIDWAIAFARQYLPVSGAFSALENIKFLALILPDAKLQLTLQWDAKAQRVDFSYANGERKYSAGRIVFSAELPAKGEVASALA